MVINVFGWLLRERDEEEVVHKIYYHNFGYYDQAHRIDWSRKRKAH